ncbi:MAG: porin [Gammaproteobacteria bacterium]|nr:porin [Gammaproteobacteria bacterium]
MNKKLLAVAISAAMVAPAAMAEVTVYGAAQVEVTSVSLEGAQRGQIGKDSNAFSGTEVADNARGRVGVKAAEDLGNGLKGIAQFEWAADTTTNNADSNSKAALTARVSQVGITGGFGTVVTGNLKSPYKYTGGVKYDPFVTTALEARRNGGMSGGALGHNSFIDNLVAYATPKGPITATFAYGPEKNDGAWAADVKYRAAGVEAFVAAIDGGDRYDYSAAKVGGSFKTGNHKIVGQYESISAGIGNPDVTVLFLGYQMKMGKNTLVAQWGQQSDKGKVADFADKDNGLKGNADYLALGVIHKLSKATRVFGGFRSSTSDNNTGRNVYTVGLRKDFKSK